MSLHPGEVLIAPVVSEKSYGQIAEQRYTFKVHQDAHKTQVAPGRRGDLRASRSMRVNIIKVQPKPKRRGDHQGRAPGLEEGDRPVAGRRVDRDLRSRASNAGPQLQAHVARPPVHDGLDFEEITKTEPEKTLLAPLHKNGGRNINGRITTRHQGGGHKRRYRVIDFKRLKDGVPAKVASIEYDPNRSARIALLHYADGEKRYILAPVRLKVGQTVESGPDADIRPGNAMPLASMPTGTHGAQRRAAARPGRQDGALGRRPPSWSPRRAAWRCCGCRPARCAAFRSTCRATVGQLGNVDHEIDPGGKAGRSRWNGKRPTVRGTVMNPVDHPHGGGEGKNKGSHPVTPWGKPTLGFRTRDKKKASDKDIVRGRRRGKGGSAMSRSSKKGPFVQTPADEAGRAR